MFQRVMISGEEERGEERKHKTGVTQRSGRRGGEGGGAGRRKGKELGNLEGFFCSAEGEGRGVSAKQAVVMGGAGEGGGGSS